MCAGDTNTKACFASDTGMQHTMLADQRSRDVHPLASSAKWQKGTPRLWSQAGTTRQRRTWLPCSPSPLPMPTCHSSRCRVCHHTALATGSRGCPQWCVQSRCHHSGSGQCLGHQSMSAAGSSSILPSLLVSCMWHTASHRVHAG